MPILKNERHELFAQQLAQGKSATEAYVLAGFKPSRKNASRLRANEDINARVVELQQAAAKSCEISLESVCRELDQAIEVARAKGQAAPLVNACSLRARLGGLLVEKVQLTQGDPFENCETITQLCAQLLKDLSRDRPGGAGFEFTSEDIAAAEALLLRHSDELDELISSCLARSVNSPNRRNPVERKRLADKRRRLFGGNGQRHP